MSILAVKGKTLQWGVARDEILAFSFETISCPGFNFDVGDARPEGI